jgi:hypothetical protein
MAGRTFATLFPWALLPPARRSVNFFVFGGVKDVSATRLFSSLHNVRVCACVWHDEKSKCTEGIRQTFALLRLCGVCVLYGCLVAHSMGQMVSLFLFDWGKEINKCWCVHFSAIATLLRTRRSISKKKKQNEKRNQNRHCLSEAKRKKKHKKRNSRG